MLHLPVGLTVWHLYCRVTFAPKLRSIIRSPGSSTTNSRDINFRRRICGIKLSTSSILPIIWANFTHLGRTTILNHQSRTYCRKPARSAISTKHTPGRYRGEKNPPQQNQSWDCGGQIRLSAGRKIREDKNSRGTTRGAQCWDHDTEPSSRCKSKVGFEEEWSKNKERGYSQHVSCLFVRDRNCN